MLPRWALLHATEIVELKTVVNMLYLYYFSCRKGRLCLEQAEWLKVGHSNGHSAWEATKYSWRAMRRKLLIL